MLAPQAMPDSATAQALQTAPAVSSQNIQAVPSQPQDTFLKNKQQQQQQEQHQNRDASSPSVANADASWQSPQQSVRTNILGLDQLSAVKQGRPEGLIGNSPSRVVTAGEAAFDAESVSTDVEAASVLESIEVSRAMTKALCSLVVYCAAV